jgi:hypothetical protein
MIKLHAADYPGGFEHNRDPARVVICAGAAGRRIIMGANQYAAAVRGAYGIGDYVPVCPVMEKDRLAADMQVATPQGRLYADSSLFKALKIIPSMTQSGYTLDMAPQKISIYLFCYRRYINHIR